MRLPFERWNRRWGLACCVSVGFLFAYSAGCKKAAPLESNAATQEAMAATVAGSQPSTTPFVPTTTQPATRPSTGPASQPASKPASAPASTFISKPPYPVSLRVASPEDEQPGWLRVMGFFENTGSATCTGVFPEQNVIEVQTNNVRELRMHIGYLPLAPRKRIVLRIDGQAIELAHKDRRFVFFERSRTGRWEVKPSAD